MFLVLSIMLARAEPPPLILRAIWLARAAAVDASWTRNDIQRLLGVPWFIEVHGPGFAFYTYTEPIYLKLHLDSEGRLFEKSVRVLGREWCLFDRRHREP
jgi:hypothetical protein